MEALGSLWAAPHPPASIHLRLIRRLRARCLLNEERVGCELRAYRHVPRDSGCEGECGVIDDGMRRALAHIEAVHEVELHDARVHHPGTAELGRAIQQGLGAERWGSHEGEQSTRKTVHDDSS